MLVRKGRNCRPPLGCIGRFPAALMKLSKPDESEEMALFPFECGLERCPLRGIVARQAMRLCQVDPQRRRVRICTGGSFEMPLCGRHIVPGKRVHTQHVVGCGMLRAELQRGLEFAEHFSSATLLLRLPCACEMLLDAGAHQGT